MRANEQLRQHLFMQANFPGVPGWTEGAIGLGHVASRDFATWVEAGPALVPGTWGGPIGGVGQPAAQPQELAASHHASVSHPPISPVRHEAPGRRRRGSVIRTRPSRTALRAAPSFSRRRARCGRDRLAHPSTPADNRA